MSRPTLQLELDIPRPHGGRRKGAGRKNRSGLQAHVRRPRLKATQPVHVTLKLRSGLPSLRRKDAFRCLREAVKTARARGFRVAHFALLGNHMHFVMETPPSGLSKSIQSLCISFARRLNAKLAREGSVFRERYHLRVLKTPSEVRRALDYVLTNEGRHRGLRLEVALDPFSSAFAFRQWKRLGLVRVQFVPTSWAEQAIENWYNEILAPARSWLLMDGWKKGR